MSSNSMERDHPEVPPLTAEPSGRVEWPRLLRVVEGVVRAELHQFEENLIAFFNSAVASAYESFIWITAQVIGAAFLLTALIMLLGIWLPWWAVFALVGVTVIAVRIAHGRQAMA